VAERRALVPPRVRVERERLLLERRVVDAERRSAAGIWSRTTA
jgi:hypothetical protein